MLLSLVFLNKAKSCLKIKNMIKKKKNEPQVKVNIFLEKLRDMITHKIIYLCQENLKDKSDTYKIIIFKPPATLKVC